MKLLTYILITLSFNVAMASSGEWMHDRLPEAIDYVVNVEKEIFGANEVQVMESVLTDDGTVYISVGPEVDGRAARNYHCWVIDYTGEDNEVKLRSRINGQLCSSVKPNLTFLI